MSAYLCKLESENPDAAIRYKQKLCLINNVDPYCTDFPSLSYTPKDFPSVTNFDIIAYLVQTTSYYTKEQLKAVKSMNAYKYFEAGFVNDCGVFKVADYAVVLGKVKHSQRMNLPPLCVWIICQEDGSVVSAHCTCMTGIGEVCSHVAAVLFAVEYIVTSCKNTSCTDVKAMWKVPVVSKVEYKPLKELDFGRTVAYSKITSEEVPTMMQADIKNVLQDIQGVGSSSVLMRVLEPFATQIASERNSTVRIENPFINLYKNEYEAFSYEELLTASSLVNINISEEDCNAIEAATREKSSSSEWYAQRAGRITASYFKRVCHTKIEKPSLSLIKLLCYPTEFNFKTKATEWGKLKETEALTAYKNHQYLTHINLEIQKVGIYINTKYPHFGASPDSVVRCMCCGLGCVEVKCPYLLKSTSIQKFCELKNSCLI